MERALTGLHHVTAIASDPQQNIDFYAGTLGLRLVKVTINYDDPGSYHFYYGDEAGRPGTILTFFAWPGGYKGRDGVGQATRTSFAVPAGAIDFWQEHLQKQGVTLQSPVVRFDERVLPFVDPDGLALELVEQPGVETRPAWTGGGVPASAAIRGFSGVTLSLRGPDRTASLLTETLGLHLNRKEGERSRYTVGEGDGVQQIDLIDAPNGSRGAVAVGTVHHVAWRTPTDEDQARWLKQLAALGYGVSPVMDRQYFHSIYFREPGGVLFEIATDPPGFTVDESVESLGAGLRLPEWMEKDRVLIERALPKIRRPKSLAEVR